MDERRPTAPAQVAKAALRRLAMAKLEPTPENYARAYAMESGNELTSQAQEAVPERAQALLNRLLTLGVVDVQTRLDIGNLIREARWDEGLRAVERVMQQSGPAAQAEAIATNVDRLMRGLERGGRQWTLARKKDGVQRVLDNNRSDPNRLLRRLAQLLSSWDGDVADAPVETESSDETPDGTGLSAEVAQFLNDEVDETDGDSAAAPTADAGARTTPTLGISERSWAQVSASLGSTVQHALFAEDERALALVQDIQTNQDQLGEQGATAQRSAATEALCVRAKRMLDHRQHLFGELGQLCRELTGSLTELSEDDSWARGQCEAMNHTLAEGLSARGVRSVSELLSGTRDRQRGLREERGRARDALKTLINRMLIELGELGEHTDRFQNSVGRYAEVIERADTLESLTGVVREMVEESRTVQALVHQTQGRLQTEHDRATSLSRRVEELEGELKRLSDEVHTDQLTQIANRRGLISAFEIEQAKQERESSTLALALLDIDNFKKLNDTLGHGAGDEALKSLASKVAQSLRPGDMVARYGGEEFVLMLPNTPLDEAQQVLTRLQRTLSASLFIHEGKDVFVTFSAGVTLYRPGESLEQALDRADEALYEAKHTGKNRTCIAE